MLGMSQMFWFAVLVVLYSMEKKTHCSCEVCGLGNVKLYAHKATHCHYTAKPAELPLFVAQLWQGDRKSNQSPRPGP